MNMHKSDVCVVGLGYIGLPTSVLLASNGYRVSGFDKNNEAVKAINSGLPHIVEPGLEDALKRVIANGSFQAYSEVKKSDVYIICVPTPISVSESDASPDPDLSYIKEAISSIGPLIKSGDALILESTSPVGTTKLMAEWLNSMGVDTANVDIAYCPERVLPGNILHELVHNDRVVGGITKTATKRIATFYKNFVLGEVIETESALAEMCKLTENSFRDLNIAFANELSLICHKEGINVSELIHLANKHPRVNILQPGIGVGGHCIAVDPWFIIARHPVESRLIKMSRNVNLQKTEWVVSEILSEISNFRKIVGKSPKVLCMGLSFKPNIDDLRESPALEIARRVGMMDCELSVIEPHISSHDEFGLQPLGEQAIKASDLVVLLVKHKLFSEIDILSALEGKKTLDFCGLLRG